MLNDIRVSVGVLGIGLLDLILHDSHFGEEQLELIGICSNLRCVLPNLLDNRVTIKLHNRRYSAPSPSKKVVRYVRTYKQGRTTSQAVQLSASVLTEEEQALLPLDAITFRKHEYGEDVYYVNGCPRQQAANDRCIVLESNNGVRFGEILFMFKRPNSELNFVVKSFCTDARQFDILLDIISGRLECHPHSVTKTMSNQLCKRRRDSLDSNAQDMRES
ncbi:hypothetical protein Y032_0537g3118 [Ancylostoma ceylanicum]|uniref:Uncharacterized protein n=1 Tax=Ancylostoma ceylanicum TaxID=53326 RepID=A0A016WRP7_9BILA|nr:hypothetical protein Y032_0537g3118 [Ancylostoma ceylanicum]